LNRFGDIRSAKQRRDGAEGLFARDRRLWIYVDQHGRLEKVAATIRSLSARQDARTGGDYSLHLLFQVVHDLQRGEWSDVS